MDRAFRTPFLRLSLFFVIVGALGIVQFAAYQPVQADSTYFQLCSGSTPNTFSQAWTDTGLIIANDNWSGVGSIEGYRGDNITASTGADPQTLLGGDDGAPVLDVNANQTDPRAFNTGGATEFHLTDPTVALAGSGTADAPYLRLYLNSTGATGLTVAYRVRDLEGPGATGTSDNAIQQAALHWRSGTSGNFTNVAAAYIADATTGPDLNASDTNVSVSLPAGALGQAQLQLRIMTTNAGGNDEWIGIDDIVITPTCAAPADEAPTATVDLAEGATNVPLISTFTYTFSEAVTIDWLSSAVSLDCGGSGISYTTNPLDLNASTATWQVLATLPANTSCTLSLNGSKVHDADTNDPPDTMVGNLTRNFTTSSFTDAAPTATVDLAEGATNVPLVSTFTYTFSEAVTIDWLSSAVSLDCGGSGISYTTNPLDLNASTATWQVLATLPANTSCTLSLNGSKVHDADTDDPPDTMAANLTRSFTTAPDTAPSVTSSSPANGATNVDNLATITVNFSEPITDDANAFSLVCNSVAQTFTGAGGSGSQFTLSPTSPLPYSASCTLTVDATKIRDNDTDDPPDNMAANYTATFTVEAAPPTCSGTLTPIHDVQGNGSTSPIVGATVTVRGIVVGDFQDIGGNRLDGFYLQEEAAEYDADPNTSEGVFVFEGSFAAPNVNVGDQVQVTGVVTEFSSSGTTLTEIATLTSVIVCSTGNPLPPATTLDLPATNATREALENMLVTIPETLTVTENFNLDRFGEIELIANGRQYTYTQLNYPSIAGYSAYTANYALHTITLDDGISASWPAEVIFPAPRLTNANSFRAGDTVAGLTGVLEQRFGVYRIQPTASVTFTQDNPRPTSVPTFATTPDVTVASFNVLNFFNGNGVGGGFPTSRGAQSIDEYNRQLNKLVTALYAIHADVFGLMEIENDSGPNQAAASLVAALNAEFGSTEYAYIDTGVMGTDEIKVAIIYRVNGVIPVGSYATLGGNPFDQNTRPPLAQTFEDTLTGARFTVVVNHFKSKGSVPSSGALPGDVDQGDGQGMSNATRVLAAELVRDWIDTNAYFSDPDVLLIGDYNSYYYEDPITVFTNAGYGQLTNNTDYSYTFDGQLGSLDHALGSPSLLPYVIGTFDWHINTDEADAHDYNIQVFTSPNVFRTAQQQAEWFNRDYYRTSDHDPIIIGLDLPNEARRFEFITQPPTSVVQNAPFTVAVELRDPFGFPVLSNGVPITLALNTNPGGSTLGGTLTVNTVNGVATFSDLTLNNLGTGYDLIATSPDITDRVSNAFNVVAGAPVTVSTQNPILTINDAGNHVAEGATVGDQFSFNLNAQPTADVVVTFTTSNPAQLLMVAPGSTNWSPTPSYSVTFSLDGRPGTGLWNRTTLVNLTAVADGFGEGVHTANINITTSSADPAFNNLVIAPQVVNIYEPGVPIISQLNFFEGDAGYYSIVLTAPPGFIAAPTRLGGLQAEVVTVTATSNNALALNLSPSILNFTRANWNIPQTVTVTSSIDGAYVITHGVSSSITINPYMDTAYGGVGTNITAGQVQVNVYDTDSNPGNGLPPEVIPPLGEEPILPEAPAGESQAPIAGS